MITTIKITAKTKERINHLRSYKRESYDEILDKMLEVLNACRNDPDKARIRLILIDKERKRNLKLDKPEVSVKKIEKQFKPKRLKRFKVGKILGYKRK